eukprot:4897831-Amphidinium_carterae.1
MLKQCSFKRSRYVNTDRWVCSMHRQTMGLVTLLQSKRHQRTHHLWTNSTSTPMAMPYMSGVTFQD